MGNSNSYISKRSRYNADTMSSQFSSFKMSDDSSWGYTRDQGTLICVHAHTHTQANISSSPSSLNHHLVLFQVQTHGGYIIPMQVELISLP